MNAVPPRRVTDGADQQRLKRFIQRALSLSLAAMGGFIASIRQVNPEIVFRFDWITLLAMLFGGWLGWVFWRVLPGETGRGRSGLRRWLPLVLWLGVLVAATLFGFAYGMKGLSGPKQREMLVGTGLATLVLGAFGFLIWRIGHFFEQDSQRYLEQHPEFRDPDDQGGADP